MQWCMTLETSANITIGHLFKAGSPVAYFVSLYLKYDTQHANNSPHDWSTKRNSIPKSQAQRENFKRTALSCAEDIYTLSSLCLNSNCKWFNTNAWPVKIIKLLFSTLNDKKSGFMKNKVCFYAWFFVKWQQATNVLKLNGWKKNIPCEKLKSVLLLCRKTKTNPGLIEHYLCYLSVLHIIMSNNCQ